MTGPRTGGGLRLAHIDIVEVQTAEGQLYLVVVIDRPSKFAFAKLVESPTRVTAFAFIEALFNADHSGRHLKRLRGLSPYELIYETCAAETERSKAYPHHQAP